MSKLLEGLADKESRKVMESLNAQMQYHFGKVIGKRTAPSWNLTTAPLRDVMEKYGVNHESK